MDGADWLRTQLTSFGCASCGQPYETGRIRVLAERDGLFFVDLGCAHCGSQAVAIVTVQIDENDSPRAETPDLIQPAGSSAPPAGAPISADDVLDVHAMLTGFDGGVPELLALLRRREGPPE
jgi:hypothetical protein